MPFAKLFRSRWSALLWAGGVLWMAADVAGYAPAKSADNQTGAESPGETDATDAVIGNRNLAILSAVMNGN